MNTGNKQVGILEFVSLHEDAFGRRRSSTKTAIPKT
jgi:hypothetical protein